MLKGESEFLSVWVSFYVSADCCAGKIYVMEEEHSGEYWLFVRLCSEFFKILTTKKKQDIFRFKRNLQTKLHCLVSRWLHRPGAAENVKLLGAWKIRERLLVKLCFKTM